MKILKALFLISGISSSFVANSAMAKFFPACRPNSVLNELCEIDLAKIHPTQFAIGMLEVESKAQDLESMSDRKFEEYLTKHAAVLVLGPRNVFYVADGHHTAAALVKIHASSMPAKIAANFSSMSDDQFEKALLEKHWTWLTDENGNSGRSFAELPQHLVDLADNPYRSLAWLVRHAGGYADSGELWADFMWAEFFRGNLHIKKSDEYLERAKKEALAIAHSPAASALPGYLPQF